MPLLPYNRTAAVDYAHRWALARNPDYYNFDKIGGDCTNFASQCLFAGARVMNYTPTFGWYYKSANDKAPAWSGVAYFYNFITREKPTAGPVAEVTDLTRAQPGDFVQLRFKPDEFGHTPVIVAVGEIPSPENILVAAHSYDTDYRPLSTYNFLEYRVLHVVGVRPR